MTICNHLNKYKTMKKIYIKPSIVVEKAVLPAIMDPLSKGTIDFAGGNGDSGSDNPPLNPEAKYYGFGTFEDFDDEEDY